VLKTPGKNPLFSPPTKHPHICKRAFALFRMIKWEMQYAKSVPGEEVSSAETL